MSLNHHSLLFKFAHSRPVEAKTGRGATKNRSFNVAQRLEVGSLKEDAFGWGFYLDHYELVYSNAWRRFVSRPDTWWRV